MAGTMEQRKFIPEAIKNGTAGFTVKPFHPDKIKNMYGRIGKGVACAYFARTRKLIGLLNISEGQETVLQWLLPISFVTCTPLN
ncbi:hypothetical protein [Desulfocucumis palustris]|nr:hypothetical protein [Desulfocucumis palustris]